MKISMKAKNVLIGLFVVLALVSGLVLAGCDPGGSPSNPFIGTWTGYDPNFDVMRVVIDQSTWTLSYPSYPQWGVDTGTYTYSGNAATLFFDGVAIGTATVSGKTMTYNQFSFTVTLSKQ